MNDACIYFANTCEYRTSLYALLYYFAAAFEFVLLENLLYLQFHDNIVECRKRV